MLATARLNFPYLLYTILVMLLKPLALNCYFIENAFPLNLLWTIRWPSRVSLVWWNFHSYLNILKLFRSKFEGHLLLREKHYYLQKFDTFYKCPVWKIPISAFNFQILNKLRFFLLKLCPRKWVSDKIEVSMFRFLNIFYNSGCLPQSDQK